MTTSSLSSALRASGIALVLLLTIVSSAAQAQTVVLNRDYDLVTDSGLVHISQMDHRWAEFSIRNDPKVTIGECGCLLSTLSTVVTQMGGMVPWFPVTYFGGIGSGFEFNPRYMDLFLTFGPDLSGASPIDEGWGFKSRAHGTCGIIPLLQALQTLGTDGAGHAVGVTAKYHAGFGPDVKDIVNRNLQQGLPTIFAYRQENSTKANHAMLIAGWDNELHGYKVLDPMVGRFAWGGLTIPTLREDVDPGEDTATGTYTIQKFEKRIEGIIEITRGGTTPGRSFVFGDDPSPIEILMTGPDGRKTGLDVATGVFHDQNARASYWDAGPWLDPLGEVPSTITPRFVTFPDAPSGRYHFVVTGVADGPFHVSAETLFGTTREVLGQWDGVITQGQVRKFEMNFSRVGPSTVAEVTNFTPHAAAGDDLSTRTGLVVNFDGRASFDPDGVLSTYAWDFGDGTSGSGAQPAKSYASPGDYTVTLTVTDADGATSTDTLVAHVILAQARPTAVPGGPFIAFASPGGDWSLVVNGFKSSDPNGDPLTYRWNFGDGSPEVSSSQSFADHVYAAPGVYPVTLVVNDGQEDSLPVTTTAEIFEAPAAHPFGKLHAELSPVCAASGEQVTLTLGEFAQFHFWDAAQSGPYVAKVPSTLPLGVTNNPGTVRLIIAGLWDERLPFVVTFLGPGRYLARVTFTVPNLAAGTYKVFYGEGASVPFTIGCPPPVNHLPIAHAGGPYAVAAGLPVTLDGSLSFDLDHDPLTYEWDFGDGEIGTGVHPVHTYAKAGQYLIVLRVSDGFGSSIARAGTHSYGKVVVEGEVSGDRVPPTTTATPTPVAGPSGWNTSDVHVSLDAVDNPGGSGVREIFAGLSGASTGSSSVAGATRDVLVVNEGETTLAFYATDNADNVEAEQRLTVRIDRTGPRISGLPSGQCPLWPPNHKLVTLATIGATDTLSGLAAGSLQITVTSTEPVDGRGDGRTAPDVVVTGGTVQLRAERSGLGAGRTYTITAVARDQAGNVTRAEGSCVVPHDQRQR